MQLKTENENSAFHTSWCEGYSSLMSSASSRALHNEKMFKSA